MQLEQEVDYSLTTRFYVAVLKRSTMELERSDGAALSGIGTLQY